MTSNPPASNRQWTLSKRPAGMIKESDLECVEVPVRTLVAGMLGWQEYATTDDSTGPTGAVRPLPPGVDPVLSLSALGGAGMTAYFGMMDIDEPQDGDVALVSGAAGATGSVAGQIAKINGADRVVGIAGGETRCKWLTEHDSDLPL